MKWAGKPKRVKTTFNGRTERGKYIKPFCPEKEERKRNDPNGRGWSPVALNSQAESTLQKIPPDPASAQCISKRRPSGTVRTPGTPGQRNRPRSSVAG